MTKNNCLLAQSLLYIVYAVMIHAQPLTLPSQTCTNHSEMLNRLRQWRT